MASESGLIDDGSFTSASTRAIAALTSAFFSVASRSWITGNIGGPLWGDSRSSLTTRTRSLARFAESIAFAQYWGEEGSSLQPEKERTAVHRATHIDERSMMTP